MASRRVEDSHVAGLKKLLSNIGVECLMAPPEESEILSVSEETVEMSPQLEEEEQIKELEAEAEEEAGPPSTPEHENASIFPTPSLRRVLPDKIRKAEGHNRIHVLPDTFRTDIDPVLIPKIAYTPPQKYIEILAELVGCTNYRSSLAEYWFLDTMANLLRRAQEDELDRATQAILMIWFCQWIKEMQYFDAADRQRMLRRFTDNMLAAARVVATEGVLPTPAQAGVFHRLEEEALPAAPPTTPPPSVFPTAPTPAPDNIVTFENDAYQCSLWSLAKIIHYIYDLFSTDFQYNLVRYIFTDTPEYTLIDAPYNMIYPKRMYAPVKAKSAKKDKSPKKDKQKAGKGKKEEPTAEFLALMEAKAQADRLLDEEEEREREEWNRRSHILPLVQATTEEYFDKYWPPPTPEPEPEPEPEKPKKKGKK